MTRPALTVGQLREALTAFPDDYNVRLVVDKRSFSGPVNCVIPGLADANRWTASEPLVRISSHDKNAQEHRRVWLYGEDRA